MDNEPVNHVKKLSISILFISITSLILISFLPWIAINPYNTGEQHLNFKMMKESDYSFLENSTNFLRVVEVIFWAIIIIAILSLFSSVLCLSKNSKKLSNILMAIGCSIIILVGMNLIYTISFIKEINDDNLIFHANIFGPFSYAYLLFILLIILLVFSIFYTINILTLLVECFRSKDKEIRKSEETKKEEPKKKDAKTIAHKNKLQTEEWTEEIEKEEESPPIEEDEDINDDANQDIEIKQVEKSYFENKTIDLEKKHAIAVQDRESKEKEEEIIIIEKKEAEKSDSEQKKPEYASFEKALSSAIEKKKKEKVSIVSDNKKEKKSVSEKKKFKVRCAQCKHIFTAELKEGESKIKCPNCGKEGSLK